MTYQHTIAKIEKAFLGNNDHGPMISLSMDYGGGHQSFQILLGIVDKSVFTHDLIFAILEAANVSEWCRLVGRTVYAVREEGYNGYIRGMAPLPTEKGTGFVLDGTIIKEYSVQ